jgi:serine/threonine protein kinase
MEIKRLKDDLEVGMKISKESVFLVSYLDVFESGDYLCLKMEYCELGDLQSQLDSERIFTEEV